MLGKVKEVKDTVKSEDSEMGRSEGWILGKDGFHRADPKWVGDRSETQPPSNNCGPTLVKKLSKSDRAGEVVDRPAPAKAKKAKNKAANASVGRSAPVVDSDPLPIKTGVNGSVLMDHLKKNSGEGWRRERKRTRAALKDEKTYIRVPLMKKKSKKVIKAGKEELSRRGNIERRGAEPESSPIKITEAVNKSQARTSLLPAKVNTSKMLVMIIQRAG